MRRTAGFCLAAAVGFAPAAAASAPLRLFVVDKSTSSLLAVDIDSGALLAKAPIGSLPDAILETADRSRLLLLERGKGEGTMCCGFKPQGKSAVTIVDSGSLATLARVERGWNLNVEEAKLTPDGRRLTLFCSGYRSKNPAETLPQELFVVDAANGALVRRLPLDRRADSFVVAPDARTGLLHFRRKQAENLPAEVLVVDLTRDAPAARIALAGEPSAPLITPASGHAVFYTKGQRSADGRQSPASLEILDLGSARLSPSLRLDVLPTEVVYGGDGTRMAFFAPRQELAKAPAIPAGLQLLDVPGARLLDAVTLDGAPGKPSLSPDGRQLVVFSGRRETTGQPPVPASLRFVDMASGTATRPLVLEGAPAPPFSSPDQRSLYLYDRRGGALGAVSLDSHVLTTLSLGVMSHVFVDRKGQQLVTLSGATSCARWRGCGELRLVRGANVAATVEVPSVPYFFAVGPGNDRLYVVGQTTMAQFDLPTMSVLGEVPLGQAAESPVTRLEFSPDGRRAVAAHAQSDRVSVFDTASMTLLASPRIGRSSVRVSKMVGAIAIAAVANVASVVDPVTYNPAVYAGASYHDVAFIRDPDPLLAIGGDGKHVYAVNKNTNDVTVVSLETGQTVQTIEEEGSALRLLPGGRVVAVVQPDWLHLIDTASNQVKQRIRFDDAHHLRFAQAPGSQRLLVLAGGDIYCLDGPSGELVAHVEGIEISKILVEEAPKTNPGIGQ